MHSNKTQTILSTFPADKPITSPLGICFFPLALKSVALFANVHLKIYDKTKTFSGKRCKKKKRNALSKGILRFASAREARDNQDDILAKLGNNFDVALLILTYTHKILEASSFMVYTF